MTTRIEYDPPVHGFPNPVLCTNCGLELAATAHVVEHMEISGLRGYEWVHPETGDTTCLLTPLGRPYDGWAATRQIEAGLRKRWADADAALGPEVPA